MPAKLWLRINNGSAANVLSGQRTFNHCLDVMKVSQAWQQLTFVHVTQTCNQSRCSESKNVPFPEAVPSRKKCLPWGCASVHACVLCACVRACNAMATTDSSTVRHTHTHTHTHTHRNTRTNSPPHTKPHTHLFWIKIVSLQLFLHCCVHVR